MSKSKDTPSSPPALTELPLGDLLEEERRARAAYAAAAQELAHAESALLPLAEALAQVAPAVDPFKANWRRDYGHGLVQLLAAPGRVPVLPSWLTGQLAAVGFAAAFVTAALQDVLKAAAECREEWTVAPDGTPFYQPGLPRAERPKAIAEITARTTSLEARHTQLVEYIAEKLRELGQQHEPAYLEHVKKRKDDEAAKAKKSAAAVQEAVEAEAEGDKWHRAASGRGPVRSAYLYGHRG